MQDLYPTFPVFFFAFTLWRGGECLLSHLWCNHLLVDHRILKIYLIVQHIFSYFKNYYNKRMEKNEKIKEIRQNFYEKKYESKLNVTHTAI